MRDPEFIQIVDHTMAEAVRKSGSWLACRIGCTECCIGPFPITQLDALRLRQGLRALTLSDPQRATRVRERAHASADRLRQSYPNETLRTVLEADEAGADEPCPALDPETGACDLYDARPVTCRTFGPAVNLGAGPLAICELCYQGASTEEIAACAVTLDLEAHETGADEETLVAFALTEDAWPGR